MEVNCGSKPQFSKAVDSVYNEAQVPPYFGKYAFVNNLKKNSLLVSYLSSVIPNYSHRNVYIFGYGDYIRFIV